MKLLVPNLLVALLFATAGACSQQKSQLERSIEKNNIYDTYPIEISGTDTCLIFGFVEDENVKVKYYLVNNAVECTGIRSVSFYGDYDIFIDRSLPSKTEDLVSDFKDFLQSTHAKQRNSMHIQIFTECKKDELKNVFPLAVHLTMAFYQNLNEEDFIPLNILFVYNADDMFEAMRLVPEFNPEI